MLLRIAAAAAGLALAGCGGGTKTETTTSTGPALPAGCSVQDVDRIVTAFLGEPDLAPPSFFQVYASYENDGMAFVSRRRAKALTHLRVRRLLGERDRLIQLRVSSQDVNHVRITFQITRFAPDFRRRGIHGRLSAGAGTIDCAHGKVAAWVQRGP